MHIIFFSRWRMRLSSSWRILLRCNQSCSVILLIILLSVVSHSWGDRLGISKIDEPRCLVNMQMLQMHVSGASIKRLHEMECCLKLNAINYWKEANNLKLIFWLLPRRIETVQGIFLSKRTLAKQNHLYLLQSATIRRSRVWHTHVNPFWTPLIMLKEKWVFH